MNEGFPAQGPVRPSEELDQTRRRVISQGQQAVFPVQSNDGNIERLTALLSAQSDHIESLYTRMTTLSQVISDLSKTIAEFSAQAQQEEGERPRGTL
jgi:septal ring factor EnvC (AmiA/AmiB activator)